MRIAAGRLSFLLSLLLPALITPGPVRAADPAAFDKGIRPLLKTYCISCHGAKKKRGGLDLERFSAGTQAVKDGEVWEQVAERVRAHEMPPEGKKQLNIEQRKQLVTWAQSAGKGKTRDCGQIASDRTFSFYRGHVMSRRLSRAEYNNSIRDLIGLDLRPADDFPADGSGGEGFDNNGDALFTSAIHVEKFLAAADRILSFLDPDAPAAKRFPSAAIEAARKRLLVASPGPGMSPHEAARRIVQQFAGRAFRRPVADAEVERLLTVFDRAQKRGSSFLESLKLPLKAVLISPHFLFLVEPEPDKDGVFPLPDYPLASRLSYFLWATMPDDELLQLAAAGKLQDDSVLRQQVRRMLRDPRSRGLAECFTTQWLGLGALGTTIRPDPERFPDFDDVLSAAMRQEGILLFDRILREDRSLIELFDADYTFVNDRLARLYGLEGVKGPQMRLVKLTDRSRGGVLGLAGVLTATSYPLRTSPVLRGKWVLEDLLGSKVPPPPPNAGELPRDDRNAQGLTFRQQLEMHRKKAECASCHQRMDPLGFALESFDPIGRFRKEQAGKPIDTTGQLPTGEKIDGPRELKAVLLKRKNELLRTLGRKLLGYALGRQLYRTDLCVIDESIKALEADRYRASILVERIVLGYPFRHRYVKK